MYRLIGVAWKRTSYPLLAHHLQWKIITFEVYKVNQEELSENILKEMLCIDQVHQRFSFHTHFTFRSN